MINIISIIIPTRYFVHMDKKYKIDMERHRNKCSQVILKKKYEVGRISLLNLKTCYIAQVIKKMSYWQGDRNRSMKQNKESRKGFPSVISTNYLVKHNSVKGKQSFQYMEQPDINRQKKKKKRKEKQNIKSPLEYHTLYKINSK